mgnify:CR=1 FL=1
MYFESRLWTFTSGVRGRIAWTTALGLASVAFGIGRLALLGWLIARLIDGAPIGGLMPPIGAIILAMIARAGLEQGRAMAAHRTAAMVQATLRRAIFDKVMALGPGYAGTQRSGALTLALTESVEQLETYFGKFLPQFGLAVLTPPLIFLAIAFIDLPVAATLLGFALLALFVPAIWQALDQRHAQGLRQAYGAFASDFLDSVQGLATLKAFGQSGARGDRLALRAQELCTRTMRVLASNVMARGITDSLIALGAAAALAVGCWRIAGGQMAVGELVVIVLLGTETFRPIRELRSALHQGMVGLSAAQGLYALFDAQPVVQDAPPRSLPPIAPTIDFDGVRFAYPGTSRMIHDGLDFHVAAGERIGIVGTSGVGKSSIVRLLMRFYDPAEGHIRIGGHDLTTLSFAQIRDRIAVVSQEATPFHGTIAENIRFGDADASDAAVEAAGEDPRERLRACLQANFLTPILDPGLLATWIAFWSMVKTDPAIAAIHAEVYGGTRTHLESLLRAAAPAMSAAHARIAAISLTALVDGLWLELCLDSSTFSPEEAQAMVEAAMTQALTV